MIKRIGNMIKKENNIIQDELNPLQDMLKDLRDMKHEFELHRNKENGVNRLMYDICIGRISEILYMLDAINVDNVNLDVCKNINDLSEFLNETEGINDDIKKSFNKLMYKPIRRYEEDCLRSNAVLQVQNLVEDMSKEDLQELLLRINNK